MYNFFKRYFTKNREEQCSTDLLLLESQLSFTYAQQDKHLLQRIIKRECLDHVDVKHYLASCLSLDISQPILLSEELERLKKYLQLYLFLDEHIRTQFDIPELDRDNIVEPFILFPLIQNAIQQVHFTSDKKPIRLKIRYVNGALQIEVSNQVNPYAENQADTAWMRFYQSRLKLYYRDKFDLFVNSNSNIFKATLHLKLS